jgi:polyketide biosynthesis enoyl-CoA hydratase PksH
MTYSTVKVRQQGPVCFLQLHRPEQKNAISQLLVDECLDVVDRMPETATILVLEGLPDVFCSGADFGEISAHAGSGQPGADPETLYALWYRLATGPFCSVAHVKGKVNAGGVGFVAACDVVLADSTVEVSLSELLFGLYPACVLPFLMRRIGFQKAHYLTLMTKPVSAQQAKEWGLIDELGASSEELLRLHLLRLRRLTRATMASYKSNVTAIHPSLLEAKPTALAANRAMFTDPQNVANIQKFVQTGRFPWD